MVSQALPGLYVQATTAPRSRQRGGRGRAVRAFGVDGVGKGDSRGVPSVVVRTGHRVRSRAHVGGRLTLGPTHRVLGSAVTGVGVEARHRVGGTLGPGEFARETVVNGERRAVVDAHDAKAGRRGEGFAHWGKLMSKPVEVGGTEVVEAATPTFAASATAARARAATHFVRGTTRTQSSMLGRGPASR